MASDFVLLLVFGDFDPLPSDLAVLHRRCDCSGLSAPESEWAPSAKALPSQSASRAKNFNSLLPVLTFALLDNRRGLHGGRGNRAIPVDVAGEVHHCGNCQKACYRAHQKGVVLKPQ